MKNLTLSILFTTVCLLFAVSLNASKANQKPITITQKDGKMLTFLLKGDEHFHYLSTTDGVLLYKQDSLYFVACTEADGSLISSGVLAHNAGQRSEEEIALINQQDRQLFLSRSTANTQARAKAALSDNSTFFPHAGSPKAVVILVEFQDSLFKNDYATTRKVFEQYLNATDEILCDEDTTVEKNYGSVKKYYSDMSNGLFTPQFDVFGPYQLPYATAYYGGSNEDSSNDENTQALISDACQLADNDVDFSQYDANGDGNVDLVCIIYAGYGQCYSGNPGTLFWPKSGTVSGGTYDGKTVLRYAASCELGGNVARTQQLGYKRIHGVGVFCHEFAHTLGLPDMYTNISPADNEAMEDWDLMDGGEYTGSSMGYYPAEFSAWEREIMGWHTIEELTDTTQITLKPLNDSEGKSYKMVSNDNSNEYFFLQNVQQTGWNKGQHGHGMLVVHVKHSTAAVTPYEHLNYSTASNRMMVVAADGLLMSSYSRDGTATTDQLYMESYKGDPFPGSMGVSELTDDTSVNTLLLDGSRLNKPIYNIQETDGIITFDYLKSQTTGIHAIHTNAQPTKCGVYTLDGRYLGTDTERLAPGLYLIDGVKRVIQHR